MDAAPRTTKSDLAKVSLSQRLPLLRFLAARLGSVEEARNALQEALT